MQYLISYFNEAEAKWKPTGTGAFIDLDAARKRMRQLAEDCDRTVSFKLISVNCFV